MSVYYKTFTSKFETIKLINLIQFEFIQMKTELISIKPSLPSHNLYNMCTSNERPGSEQHLQTFILNGRIDGELGIV